MSHAAPQKASNFNTTRFTIYMLSTALFIAILLYSIGATHFTNYATNPKTGTEKAAPGGEAPAGHEEGHGHGHSH
jgi:hypothetical protein